MKLKECCAILCLLFTVYLSAEESGVLSNGLEYHLLHNQTTKGRASVWLVVKVGMLHENDYEKGFAHLVEHLVWRGTKNLSEQQIYHELSFLGINETTSHLTAYTTMDATFFKLDISSLQPHALERAVFLLKEIASSALIHPDVLDDEKKNILQELRDAIKSPTLIKLEKQLSVLLQRPLTFFTHQVLESTQKASSEALQNFYHSKYRPDRMALIAIGDFDEVALRKNVDECFSSMENPVESTHEYKNIPTEVRSSVLLYKNEEFQLPQVSVAYLLPLELQSYAQQHLVPIIKQYLNPLVKEAVVLDCWSNLTVVSNAHLLLEAGVVLFDETAILDLTERFIQIVDGIEQQDAITNKFIPSSNHEFARVYAEQFLSHSFTKGSIIDNHPHFAHKLKDCPKVITVACKG